MEEKRYLDEDLEYALHLLNQPELLCVKEAVQWLDNPDHKELYYSLLAMRESILSNDKNKIDVKAEWKQFNTRHKVMPAKTSRHSFWWGAAAGTIALLIAFSFLYIYDQDLTTEKVVVYTAIPEKTDVVLQTASGRSLNLSSQAAMKELEKAQTIDIKKDAISYLPAPSNDKTAEIHTLSTPQGKNFKVVLSDGTEVWMNAESRLRYPDQFFGNERIVELEGEAYFHVTNNKKQPFIVKTKTATTRVLGTKFNFRAYDYENTHVTLINGSVVVTESNSQQQVLLHPGEDIQIDKEHKITVNSVDIRSFIAWCDGYFYFKDVELSEIMRSIGRWYNLTVEFNDKDKTHLRFNFWARQDNGVEDVLQLLNQIGKVKAELKDNVIIVK